MKEKKGNGEMENNNEVVISQEWYESLIEFRTKYITLTNYLLDEAKVGSDGKLSIFTNVADMLCALEYGKTQARLCELQREQKKQNDLSSYLSVNAFNNAFKQGEDK